MQSRRDWRADNSLPIIANGAQRVRAQERPTQATRKVAPAWEFMKKVASIARAKKVWPQNQSWEMRNFFEGVVYEEALFKAGRINGRRMLARKATMAKRKLAKVPKRIASSHSPSPSSGSAEAEVTLGMRATLFIVWMEPGVRSRAFTRAASAGH